MTRRLDPPLSVLVTGAAGFIASHLVDELLACGHLVRGLDRRCPHRDPAAAANLASALAHPRFRYLHADLTRDTLGPAVDGCTIVFHFAAPPVLSDIRSVQLGLPPADAHATANLLDACHDAGVVRLVFASCTSVYRPRPGPHCETSLLKPRTVHGWTKLANEQMCLVHGIPPDATMSVVALRYGDVYGPRQNPMELIPRILTAVHTGAPVDLFGTPAGPPQFLHVFDAVRAALTAAAATPIREAAVNIAGPQTATTAQLIGLVRHLTGVTVHVAPGYPPPDAAADTVDLTKAGRVLGFKPFVAIDEGLHGYLDSINSCDSAPLWPYRTAPHTGTARTCLSRVIPPTWSNR